MSANARSSANAATPGGDRGKGGGRSGRAGKENQKGQRGNRKGGGGKGNGTGKRGGDSGKVRIPIAAILKYDGPIADATIACHLERLHELATNILAQPPVYERMALLCPETPLKRISIKPKNFVSNGPSKTNKVFIELHLESPSHDITDLLDEIKSVFTGIYAERLICSVCQSSIPLGEHICNCTSKGCKKWLPNVKDDYSGFVTEKNARDIHSNKLKHAGDADDGVVRITNIVTGASLEEEMASLALEDPRNKDAEAEFIAYFNNLPQKTILRQRIRGHRTRPLSLSAADMRSTSSLMDLVLGNSTEPRIMCADLEPLAPVFDKLLDEMGRDPDEAQNWKRACNQSVLLEFGDQFGTVPLSGSPDAMFKGVPVELKTVRKSLREGATTEKVKKWLLQVATYQRTHSTNNGAAGNAVLIIVSLEDFEVLALNIGPKNFRHAKETWGKNLSTVFTNPRRMWMKKYWDHLVEFRNKGEATRKQLFRQAVGTIKKWLNADAKEQLEAGIATVPMLRDKETDTFCTAVAKTFQRDMSVARKLVLKGRLQWMVKKDREERGLLNQIKKNVDLQALYTSGMVHVHERWDQLQQHLESASKDDFDYVRDVLDLMKHLAKWQDRRKAEKEIVAFLAEVRDQKKKCKRVSHLHGGDATINIPDDVATDGDSSVASEEEEAPEEADGKLPADE